MSATAWTAWYDDVLPDIPGVLQALAKHHVKLAAIEFFERSHCWVVDQGPIAIAPRVSTYDWDVPATTRVAMALRVWIDGVPLDPEVPGRLSEIYGDYMSIEGDPAAFLQENYAELIVVPKPAAGGRSLTAKVALTPLRAATGMDSRIAEQHFDAITTGALARLFAMPKKPWTDAQEAANRKAEFEAAIVKARVAAQRGLTRARIRVKAQFM